MERLIPVLFALPTTSVPIPGLQQPAERGGGCHGCSQVESDSWHWNYQLYHLICRSLAFTGGKDSKVFQGRSPYVLYLLTTPDLPKFHLLLLLPLSFLCPRRLFCFSLFLDVWMQKVLMYYSSKRAPKHLRLPVKPTYQEQKALWAPSFVLSH